ncbi:MAG: septum formation initiator family protein [Lachnospiraceae bacterium]|nr:septum formation initiator family protein [Lachnospiraceae bacterium]
MRKVKKSKGRRSINIILSLTLVIFAFYAVFTLVNQQIEISRRKEELKAFQDSIAIQELKNNEIKQVYELDDDENDAYIERVAREEFDYSKQGERVFINIAGE